MTTTIIKDVEQLNDRLANQKKPVEKMLWFNGVVDQTEYEMPIGWEPIFVTVSGLIVRDGEDEAYTFPYTGTRYKLVFDVAPGEVSIGAYSKRVV